VIPKISGPKSATAIPKHRVSSSILFGPRKELVIVHNGREYQLRLTQNGKLILTASPCELRS
jgi:hemin uptake protein HemP